MRTSLRRILRPTKPGYTVVSELLEILDVPLLVWNVDGAPLLGSPEASQAKRTPILLGTEPAGWVSGPMPQAAALINLLESMLAQEAEKRALADELLDSYRELNILYNLSDHLLATPEPETIARTTLQEIGLLVNKKAAWVMLLDEETQESHTIAANGAAPVLKNSIAKNEFIAGILARNEAEICNAVPGSEIFSDHPQVQQYALLCAPLKTEQRALGLILLMRESPGSFTARDLKLLNSVALQAGPAIEMARLYKIAIIQGRMERELQMASEVQASLIPAQAPSISTPGWDFAGRWRPARELSGDYYDFIPLGEHKYGLVIADVADKGMSSALFMVNTRSAVRTAVDQTDSPIAAIATANKLVAREATDGLFVTLIYGELDTQTGSLIYVNAGHNPALHYHAADDGLSELPLSGIPLGILSANDYTQREIQIGRGDTLILYTDGVTEAMNVDFGEFGIERLRAVLLDNKNNSAGKMADAIESAVDQFTGSAPVFDDFTLMIVRRQR